MKCKYFLFNVTSLLFFFRASLFTLLSSKIIKPIAIRVCLKAIKMSLHSKAIELHTHTEAEVFISWESGVFLRLLIDLIFFYRDQKNAQLLSTAYAVLELTTKSCSLSRK